MSPVWIAVAILFAFIGAVILCALVAFCFYMLLQVRKMQVSADAGVRAINEMLGDGSVARASKAVSGIVLYLPDLINAMKALLTMMEEFKKLAISQPSKSAVTDAASADDSALYPYSEAAQADFERSEVAKAEKLTLSDDQLSRFRTEIPGYPQSGSSNQAEPSRSSEEETGLTPVAV